MWCSLVSPLSNPLPQLARNDCRDDLESRCCADVLSLSGSVVHHWLELQFSSCKTIRLVLCRCERRYFLSRYAGSAYLDRQWNHGILVARSILETSKPMVIKRIGVCAEETNNKCP